MRSLLLAIIVAFPTVCFAQGVGFSASERAEYRHDLKRIRNRAQRLRRERDWPERQDHIRQRIPIDPEALRRSRERKRRRAERRQRVRKTRERILSAYNPRTGRLIGKGYSDLSRTEKRIIQNHMDLLRQQRSQTSQAAWRRRGAALNRMMNSAAYKRAAARNSGSKRTYHFIGNGNIYQGGVTIRHRGNQTFIRRFNYP